MLDFLSDWLPGLHRDGHLVGTNWTGDLIGVEFEPRDVQEQLREQMPAEMVERYRPALR